MILTLKEACDVLGIEPGVCDKLVIDMIAAVPWYIQATTGVKEAEQMNDPLCKKAAGLILTLWYHRSDPRNRTLSRSINNLLNGIAMKAGSK